MKTRVRLVVIGAGIVGCSAVWHLAQRGWDDILVIDRGYLPRTGGSTVHDKVLQPLCMEGPALLSSCRRHRSGDDAGALNRPAPQAGLGQRP
ncbi:MAG: FAD-dependent oxidoreductase [Caldilineaceae bacterium]|nr:FAD-dependent oxidoreductase [Caldilineaceae bacterium]HRJ43952.1 FAD-dependent oxidoreductase [Caldilineaceae bacterium]